MSSPLPQFDPSSAASPGALAPSLDRREFLAHGTLAAVAAVLFAACGDGVGGGSPTGPTGVNVTATVASYAALANVGGIARLTGTSTPIAVVRTGASAFRAFSMICPHEGSVINVTSSGFLCPNHAASFTPSGTNNGGQRTSSLFEFTVVYNDAAGTLTITS